MTHQIRTTAATGPTGRDRTTSPELLAAFDALLGQIEQLRGESSCIDEDLLQGEPYRAARAALAAATVS